MQFKTIFIPDYTETESCFIFKCHHCLADGLGLLTLLMNLQDTYDVKQLPQMKKFSLIEKIYINLLTPLITAKLIVETFIFEKNEKNGIR